MRQGKAEAKRGTPPDHALDSQPPSEYLGQSSGDREAEPRPKPRMGVKALERFEDPLLQLRRDPGSVVADPEYHRGRLRLNLDGDNAPFWAVPHSVGQQVHEDLLEPNGVGAESGRSVGTSLVECDALCLRHRAHTAERAMH